MPLSLTLPKCHIALTQHQTRSFQRQGTINLESCRAATAMPSFGSSHGEQHQFRTPASLGAPCQHLLPLLGCCSPLWSIKLHSHSTVLCVCMGSNRTQFYSLGINATEVTEKQNTSMQAISPILRASGPTNALMMFAEG